MRRRTSSFFGFLAALCLGGAAVSSADDRVPVGPSPAPTPAATPANSSGPMAVLDTALDPAQKAEKAFLEHLGWTFVVDPSVKSVEVRGGSPLRRANVAQARAAGDLRVLLPATLTPDEASRFAKTLPSVADSLPTRGAWQLLQIPAVERATSKLAANAIRGFWTFPQWAVVNAPVFSMDPPDGTWIRVKKICRAKEKPSAAIESFYTQTCSTECYVAQTIASYAIQYELYGPAWFDENFKPEEIAIGQVDKFHETPLGATMNAPPEYPWRALVLQKSDYTGEDLGLVLSRMGPSVFPGLSGILLDQNQTGRSNQNLTFVSLTPAAVDSLARNGGFAHVAELTQELLRLEKATRARFATGSDITAIRERTAALLAEPVFTGMRVYIHPYGVVTLGEMVDKFRRRDRTAFQILLYDEAREDTFFQRYKQAWKTRWARGGHAR